MIEHGVVVLIVITGAGVFEHVVVVVVVNGGVVVLIVISGRTCRSVGGKMGCECVPWDAFFIQFTTLAALTNRVA